MSDDDSDNVFYDTMLNDILIRYTQLMKAKDFLDYNGNFDNNKRFFILDNIEQEIAVIEEEINSLGVN